jgi:predicted NBD/HSP70 family sugar kinase
LAAGTAVAALGLQVNVAGLAARVVDLSGRVVAERLLSKSLVDSDPAVVLTRLRALALGCLAEVPASVRVVGARLALPGVVSVASGVLLVAPNLGWREVRPADYLGQPTLEGLHLRLGNEADLAARTVADVAPGRPGPLRDFVYISGEIGIGGSAVVDGEVLSGRHGWAGEMGHVCVDPEGPRCRCGSTGCLEQYAGRDAIAAAAGADPSAVVDLVRAGDERALGSIRIAARALGIALAGVVNVLDIPTVVLGGYLGQIGDVLTPGLEAHLAARVLSSRWVTPTVRVATEHPAAGATGAAFAELNAVLSHPAPWMDVRERRSC